MPTSSPDYTTLSGIAEEILYFIENGKGADANGNTDAAKQFFADELAEIIFQVRLGEDFTISLEDLGIDLDNYYTKTEIDDNFYTIIDIDDMFDDYYNITEIDDLLDDYIPLAGTAVGKPVTGNIEINSGVKFHYTAAPIENSLTFSSGTSIWLKRNTTAGNPIYTQLEQSGVFIKGSAFDVSNFRSAWEQRSSVYEFYSNHPSFSWRILTGSTYAFTVNANQSSVFLGNFTATSGSAAWDNVRITSTISGSGGYTGLTSVLHLNPTSVVAPTETFAAFRITLPTFANTQYGIYQTGGVNSRNYFQSFTGINVTSPAYQLDVGGDIAMTGNLVTPDSNGADFIMSGNGSSLFRAWHVLGVSNGAYFHGRGTSSPYAVGISAGGTGQTADIKIMSDTKNCGIGYSSVLTSSVISSRLSVLGPAFTTTANTDVALLEAGTTATSGLAGAKISLLFRMGWPSPSSTIYYNAGRVQIIAEKQWDGTAANRDSSIVLQNSLAGAMQDVAIWNSAKVFLAQAQIRPKSYTYATLPTATSAASDIIYVTDSNTATIGATITGTGANPVWAGYRGGNWIVIA